MFPFQGGYELSFQYNDAGEQEQNNMNIEDLILLENHAKSAGVGGNMKRSRGRKSSSLATNSSSHNVNNDDYEKKIIHREVERQRRHEMSNLYTSLRSVLPAESIKGKRSISDHVGEAMNYIKKLEKNVKELGEKRDELRINSQEMITSSRHEVCGSSNFLPGNVAIQQVLGGLQIDINVSYEDERFSLATALQVVLEEGLSVASCSSTRIINGRLVHNMLCESMIGIGSSNIIPERLGMAMTGGSDSDPWCGVAEEKTVSGFRLRRGDQKRDYVFFDILFFSFILQRLRPAYVTGGGVVADL